MMRSCALSRRTLLRGAGAALGLPWLEAMMPRAASAAATNTAGPVRMAVLYMPNGVHPGMWTPEGEGRKFELSPTLEPLADLRDELLIPTSLWNEEARGSEG